jgi:hypothetical protein
MKAFSANRGAEGLVFSLKQIFSESPFARFGMRLGQQIVATPASPVERRIAMQKRHVASAWSGRLMTYF